MCLRGVGLDGRQDGVVVVAEQSRDRSAEDVVVEQHGRQRPGVNSYGRNVVPKNS